MSGRESMNVIAAFTEDQAARLTGVSKRQLASWYKSGFFVPSIDFHESGRAYSRLYSFRDLLSLRVLNQLRNETRVSFPHLREVKEELSHLGDERWVKSILYVRGKKVVIERENATRYEAGSGQEVLQIPLKIVVSGMHERIKQLGVRDADKIGSIERKRGVVHNQAVIAGTRVPVSSVKSFADAGYSVDQIKREYPSLTEDDIRAAIAFDEAA
ncbi:DUF433 domain-containing protein [Mesorhizobium australicum]|uniref:MerR HTH family regulatory protein n=1 Tax=Mesorhizobium australicum TaxID=536018 RepID=A0A1X7PUR7_9HYPH|nr:DUF433 domain-containing protein [Mesorhizobium australicum]SMH55237.1 MerR HTH family regulatory protein [Mesorhizobium australicum]